MSVIAELRVDPDAFELGRILELQERESIELETMVPIGQRTVPFFRVHELSSEQFEESVSAHPSVTRVREIDRFGDERRYALDWDTSTDRFFDALAAARAQILRARGTADTWDFEIRFPSHDRLSSFHSACVEAEIPLTVARIYNPTKPDTDAWFGLSPPQREALTRAVEGGYYTIPRKVSTLDLADEFGISDQAVTERLRRAIVTLVEHTLLVPADEQTDPWDDD